MRCRKNTWVSKWMWYIRPSFDGKEGFYMNSKTLNLVKMKKNNRIFENWKVGCPLKVLSALRGNITVNAKKTRFFKNFFWWKEKEYNYNDLGSYYLYIEIKNYKSSIKNVTKW